MKKQSAYAVGAKKDGAELVRALLISDLRLIAIGLFSDKIRLIDSLASKLLSSQQHFFHRMDGILRAEALPTLNGFFFVVGQLVRVIK